MIGFSGSRTLVGSGTTIGERSVWNLVDLIVKMRLKRYGGFLEAALSLPTCAPGSLYHELASSAVLNSLWGFHPVPVEIRS